LIRNLGSASDTAYLKAAPEFLHARDLSSPIDPHLALFISWPYICHRALVPNRESGVPQASEKMRRTISMPRLGLCSRAISHAEQQAIYADIFVQTLPMEPAAAAADDVPLALLIVRLEKPREVSEWDRKLAAISKEHPQIVRVEP